MAHKRMSRREMLRLAGLGAAGAALAACQPKTVIVEKEVEKVVTQVVTQVVKETVKETVIVEGTPKVVEREVTKIVEREVEKVVTVAPEPAEEVELQFLRQAEVITPDEPVAVLLEGFHESHPGVKVKTVTTTSGDDYFTKLVTMTAAGTPPDLFEMPPWKLAVFVEENLLADLGPLVEAWGFDLDNIPEPLVDAYSWGGVLLGMPVMGSNVYLIGYNKDVFDEAGVEYPPRNWTWDECLETAKKVTIDEDGDGDPEIWGLTFNVINPSRLLPYLWSWGADFYNYPELTKCTLNSPEAVGALEFALSWIREHKVSPPPEMGASELGITFDAGLVAMADVGSGAWVDPKDPSQFRWGFNWGLTDFPKDVATRTLIHSNGLSIARTSKHRDTAWELLQFLMSEESQILYSKRVGKVSALKSVGANYAFENLPPEDLQVVNDAIEYAWGRAHWRTPVWDKSASGTQVPEMEAAWLGEQSVKEALDRTCEQVDAMFAELETE